MAEDTSMPFASPGFIPGRERNDEPQPATGQQPPADGAANTSPQAGSSATDTTVADDTSTQTQGENWEQRFKDTQRTLSDRDQTLAVMQAQLDVLKAVATQRQAEPPQPAFDFEAERKKVAEEAVTNPAAVLEFNEKVRALQDGYWARQTAELRQQIEELRAQTDPAYAEVKSGLDAIADLPEIKALTPRARVELAKRMKAVYAGQTRMQPPAGMPAGRRVMPEPPKQPDNVEKFRPWLVASGAIKPGSDDAKPAFTFERMRK